MKTNCLFWAIKYRLLNRGSKLMAEWDDELNWYHYYIIHNNFELHCEQKFPKHKWSIFFEYKIRKIRLRRKNKK